MRIGYACVTVGVPHTRSRNCRENTLSEEKLTWLIAHNLNALDNIIDYNMRSGIRLFRISSDLIPFGSSPKNTLPWQQIFGDRLQAIGQKIKKAGMRVSMHPGQYTVLNSGKPDVVKRSVDDLDYHASVLDSLGVGPEHKIVLHLGGMYGNKQDAKGRFLTHCAYLDPAVMRRLAIENDDRLFHIGDVLETGHALSVPVVFDYLHNQVNPGKPSADHAYWINACRETWQQRDGNQKIHYSQQDSAKQPGAHSQTISVQAFLDFCQTIDTGSLNIMLEVKDKNLSAVKCINCTSVQNIKVLEEEWSRYKYTVLERAPADYVKIRQLLKDKNAYPAVPFYTIIEGALKKEPETGHAVNAAQHVWGYFKDVATEKEQNRFEDVLSRYEQGKAKLSSVKKQLERMTEKYEQTYLRNSYYFAL